VADFERWIVGVTTTTWFTTTSVAFDGVVTWPNGFDAVT
jgi:hypothetical protein